MLPGWGAGGSTQTGCRGRDIPTLSQEDGAQFTKQMETDSAGRGGREWRGV